MWSGVEGGVMIGAVWVAGGGAKGFVSGSGVG